MVKERKRYAKENSFNNNAGISVTGDDGEQGFHGWYKTGTHPVHSGIHKYINIANKVVGPAEMVLRQQFDVPGGVSETRRHDDASRDDNHL